MVDALIGHPCVDPERIVLVGRSFGGLIGPRGASGEHRLAAMIVDPGQMEMGSAVIAKLGDLGKRVDDPSADDQFEALLRYTNEHTASAITSPSFVTDNETDTVSVGQGKVLYEALTCQKSFRLFTKAEGAEGHCEGMAPIVFWTAALNWLDDLLG